MKVKIVLAIALAGVLGLSACNDFLSVKPVGKLIPSEVAEYEALLNSSKVTDKLFAFNGQNVLLFMTDNVVYSDNVVKYYYNPSNKHLSTLAAYSFTPPYMDLNLEDDLYYRSYIAVGIFNNVIDGIAELGKRNDPIGKNVIGQARAARAWVYLNMAMTYGPMYNPTGDNSKKSISYRTSGDVAVPSPPLSTTKEAFKLAEEDLLFAVENCPEQVVSPVRASKAAAKALLAYLYMYKGDFEKMYTYSRQAWDMQVAKFSEAGLFYNYNAISYKPKNPIPVVEPGVDVRTMLEIVTPDNLHNQGYNRENLLFRKHSPDLSNTQLSQEYLNLFDVNKDLRYQLFLLNKKGFNITKEGQLYSDGIVKLDYRITRFAGSIGMTNPELLLMLAESAARTGRSGEALAALNTLRKYRYKTGTPDVALAGDALIQEILNERRREIHVTSPVHYWDIRRLAYESGKPWSKRTLTRTILGKQYSADVLSEKYQLKIGNIYIGFNPHWGLTPDYTPWLPYSQFQQ